MNKWDLDVLVKYAIQINKAKREELGDLYYELSRVDRYRNYCTIHIDVGRRTGKTSLINEIADAHDVIVVANQQHKKYLVTNERARVFTANELVRAFEPIHAEAVYVDEPALVFAQITKESFYTRFGSVDTFIMLGE